MLLLPVRSTSTIAADYGFLGVLRQRLRSPGTNQGSVIHSSVLQIARKAATSVFKVPTDPAVLSSHWSPKNVLVLLHGDWLVKLIVLEKLATLVWIAYMTWFQSTCPLGMVVLTAVLGFVLSNKSLFPHKQYKVKLREKYSWCLLKIRKDMIMGLLFHQWNLLGLLISALCKARVWLNVLHDISCTSRDTVYIDTLLCAHQGCWGWI